MAISKEKKNEIIAQYARHEGDTGSVEVQVAVLTWEINHLNEHIKGLSDDEIMDVEIPNFPPLVFEFDEKLNVVSEYYLGK